MSLSWSVRRGSCMRYGRRRPIWRSGEARWRTRCASPPPSPSAACISARRFIPFLADHPEIELTLDLDDRRVDASSDGYDAIIRHGLIADLATGCLETRSQPSASRRIAGLSRAQRHAGLAGGPRRSPRIILHQPRRCRLAFPGAGRRRRYQGKLALGINNGDVCRDAAIAGLGIALLPAFVAGPAVNSGHLVEIDVGSRPEAEFIFMAHPEGRNPRQSCAPSPIT